MTNGRRERGVMGVFIRNASAWQAPVELQRSTPREVQLTGAGRVAVVTMILLVLAAVAGSIGLVARAKADESRWKSWSAEAVSTQGQVTGLHKRGSGNSTKYYVDFTYRVGESKISATGAVGSRQWRRWKPGDELEVVYRRSEPRQSWLPGHEPRGVPWFAGLLFAVVLLIPVPVMAYVLRRQQRLLEEGRAAEATVVTSQKRAHDRGGHYAVEYEFATLEGSRRTGKFNANRKPPAQGEKLTIVYHPDEEGWSERYPLSLVRVRTYD